MRLIAKNHSQVLRYALFIFLPFALLGCVVFVYFAQADLVEEKKRLDERRTMRMAHLSEQLTLSLTVFINDLLRGKANLENHIFLAENGHTSEVIDHELLSFLRFKPTVFALSFTDEYGMEKRKAISRKGVASLVSEDRLQTQKGQVVFEKTMALKPGQLSISLVDPSMEDDISVEGMAERVLRLSAPLFDKQGRRLGVFTVYSSCAEILECFHHATATSPGNIKLYSGDGFILAEHHPAKAKGELSGGSPSLSLLQRDPDSWGIIQRSVAGLFNVVSGRFAFASVFPLSNPSIQCEGKDCLFNVEVEPVLSQTEFLLKIVCFIDKEELSEAITGYERHYWFIFMMATGLLGACAWVWGAELVRRENDLDNSNCEKKRLDALVVQSTRVLNDKIMELEEREALLKALQDASSEAVMLSRDGVGICQNEAARGILGYADDEVDGGNIFDCIVSEYHKLVKQKLQEERPSKYRIRMIRKDGSIFPAEVSGRTVTSRGEELRVTAVRDLSAETQMQMLSEAVEQAGEGICVADNAGKIIFVNKAWANWHGWSKEELLGQHITISHPPEECAKVKMAHASVCATGRFSGELLHKRRDGSTFPTLMEASLVKDWNGNAFCSVATIRDMTQQKKDELRLQRSKNRYRTLVQTQTDLICRFQSDGTLTFVNKAYCDFFGQDHTLLVGQKHQIIIPEDEQERVAKVWAKLSKENPEMSCEHKVVCKNGEIRWHVWITHALLNANGEVCEFQAVGRDITDRIEAEKALCQSEEKYRAVVDSVNDSITITSMSGRILEANRSTYESLGYVREELLGMNVMELDTPEFAARNPERMAGIKERGWILFETAHKRKDGTVMPVEINCRLFIYNGESCYLEVWRDLSERKKMDEMLRKSYSSLEKEVELRTRELAQSHEMLLHAEKLAAIGRLSASIAHEFNNPLYGIQNVLEGIRDNCQLEGDYHELVNLSLSECNRVKNLIQSMHDFNRPSDGKREALDIHAELDFILAMTKKACKNRKIVIRKLYCQKTAQIYGVMDQVKQVFLNLVNNAIDAMEENGGELTVSTEVLDKNILIRFQDTGKGISPEIMKEIFEPFFTTKSAIKGTGLGLSISYGIIQNHNGKIEAESRLGKGSVFTVFLPTRGPHRSNKGRDDDKQIHTLG